ncbi:MAG: 2-hydroxyacid dehydrogenase [Burkholderiaceae bacterium]
MKALLHYRASALLQQRLRAAMPPWVEVVTIDEGDEQALLREIANTQVLLHVLKPVTRAMMQAAPQLRLIQKIGVGVNTIDLRAASERGIQVANMPGSNSQAVCEMTLALMLAVLRKLLPFDAATRRGAGWSFAPDATDAVGEIGGKTVGLVGYGDVARRVALVCKALGARVVFTARTAQSDANAQAVSLTELLSQSDIVSLHVPLTDATRRIIDAAAIARMKPGAMLVNTARGALVDEAALLAALQSGHLRGAGLDVFDQEPAAADNPLFQLPNVVVMPHLAWLTAETLERSFGVAVENCTRLRDGVALRHAIALPG